jgi:hypothetical protein
VLIVLGVILTLAAAAALVMLACRAPGRRPYPWYGWVCLGALVGLELLLLAAHVPVVETFFTAWIWTVYIGAVDAAVYRWRGDSLLHHAAAFWGMAGLSIPAWLIFEAYNLRLRNWAYVGLPRHFWELAVGAGWAFATIFPGLFETAELIHASFAQGLRCRPWRRRAGAPWVTAGVVLLVAPLLAPARWGGYLFALVWAGFILLLEPLHREGGWPSLWADLEAGQPGRGVALLLAGGACGFFWEFWNYWARSRWEYIFPILHRWRIFAMPVPGFLGFPPFAWECFALYTLLAQLLLPPGWRADLLPGAGASAAAPARASQRP